MTRDELLLAALGAGEATTAELVRSTGIMERSCRYGLRHLIVTGYAWSPERGLWRLTEAGRAIASALASLPAIDQPDAPSIAPPFGEGATATAKETAELASPPEDPSGTPASVWWTILGIGVAVVLALARRSGSAPPPPPAAPPTVWPYDGWHI